MGHLPGHKAGWTVRSFLSRTVRQTGWLKTTEMYHFTVLYVRILKSSGQEDRALSEAYRGESFLASSQILVVCQLPMMFPGLQLL